MQQDSRHEADGSPKRRGTAEKVGAVVAVWVALAFMAVVGAGASWAVGEIVRHIP